MREKIPLLILSGVIFLAGEGFARWLDIGDPPAFEKHDKYGYLMRPDQSVSTRGNRFQINRAGFRGIDLRSPRDPHVYRIAFVGDSVTYGGGSIPDRDLFVNRVASRFGVLTHHSVEAANISAPGWGIPNMAAYIETHGLADVDL